MTRADFKMLLSSYGTNNANNAPILKRHFKVSTVGEYPKMVPNDKQIYGYHWQITIEW